MAIQNQDSANGWQPRILGFLCNWCSYAGADLAGVSRFQYPPTVRIIRVMCSARVEPAFVLRAFLRGTDGVLVLGCHFGDCHYISGNYRCRDRMEITKELLNLLGIVPERLYLGWVSAAEGQQFAQIIADFTEQLMGIGPLGKGFQRKRSCAAMVMLAIKALPSKTALSTTQSGQILSSSSKKRFTICNMLTPWTAD